MRIGIDATALPTPLFGAGNYIAHLIRALTRVDEKNEYIIFAKPSHSSLFDSSRIQVEHVSLPTRILRIAWEQSLLPFLARHFRLDVLHSPHYTMPLLRTCPTIVTFHDMTFFIHPEMHQAYKRVFFQTAIRLSARRADAIIADSESTKLDVARLLNLAKDRITAVPLGVSAIFRPSIEPAKVESVRAKYGLPTNFILSVGVFEPRKNLAALLQAFRRLVKDGSKYSFVVVGQKGWMYSQLFEAARELNDRVLFTGYVLDEDLPALYSAADLFVYPSFYEGFGLPVLEAMACGVPVITSDVSSMPEIAGDAAILVDPRDEGALAAAMNRVLTDRALRDKLASDGRERSKLFSWERTARETLGVYERVARPQ